MAATTMTMPSHIQNGTVFYPSLNAYNSALYEYTRRQFEAAQRESRRRAEKRNSSGPKSHSPKSA